MPASIMSRRSPLALALLLATAPACGIDEGGTNVFVFSTHHATPENGVFPERGEDNKPRQFFNDTGWEITLLESYVTMSAVSVVRCDETEIPLNMFWGPCPEDLRDEDLATLTVAGNKLSPGNYCQLLVQYGPYTTPIIDDEETTRHQTPDNPDVEGATVYLRGGAKQSEDSDSVLFELRATGTRLVDLDLSMIDEGKPLIVDKEEAFPKELTVSKTYDRFFDGIDFNNFDSAALEDDLIDILVDITRVQQGTTVSMEGL